MIKLALIATLSLVVSKVDASVVEDKLSLKDDKWPNIKYYHTYKASGRVYPWSFYGLFDRIDQSKAVRFTEIGDSTKDMTVFHS